MRLFPLVRFCFVAIALNGYTFAQTTHPRIAVVFDDGPYVGQVDGFLSLLAREQVRVTFSHVGQNVDAHPELCRSVAIAGHEIFNHSYTHPHFDTITDAAIQSEITRTQAAVLAATGRAPAGSGYPTVVGMIVSPPMGALRACSLSRWSFLTALRLTIGCRKRRSRRSTCVPRPASSIGC
jgi:peptidoglycan/xylan/chitin deacetylase (PgdA/CDA1 family)